MDVVEWCRALDVRLSEWWCILSMVWVQIPSREEQKFDTQKSNSNTVWFNFQTYIYIRLKIKPNSVKIRFLSCQICVFASTGLDLTPLIHCSTIRLVLRPAPLTTRPHPLYILQDLPSYLNDICLTPFLALISGEVTCTEDNLWRF